MILKRLTLSLALLIVGSLAACQEEALAPVGLTGPVLGVGNGYPGQHDFLLNIIGVPKDKTAAMDDNNGRRIFVRLNGGQKVCVTDEDWQSYQELQGVDPADFTANPYACTAEEWENSLQGGKGKVTGGWDGLDKVNKILLTPNTANLFGVIDANATDRNGAEFTMPDDVATEYRVYARALGKPGGQAAITLCGNETEDTSDDIDGDGIADTETWCSIDQAVLTRDRGRPVTEDVTTALFTMSILVDVDDAKDVALTACLAEGNLIDIANPELQVADVPIFHACFEDYFWNYDNRGLKLLQLRFFQVPS